MRNKIIFPLALFLGAAIGYGTTVNISPNMGMPVPVTGQTPGPEWANDINASLSIIDSHDHSAGHGVQISPDGLDINTDLTFGGNDATHVRSVSFDAQGSPISGSELDAVYVSGVDLYYNDGSGNQVRITNGGNVNAGAGSITGLPSGTASAAFAASTFTFQSATSTPAIMAVGPVKIGTNTASSKTVTLAPPGGLAANYDLTFPSALPGSTSFLDADTSGNMAFVASTGSGSVVLATGPTISGPTISGTATFSGQIADPLTISGSHATGNGTKLHLLNTSTSADFIIYGGSGNDSPTIDVDSNDDLVVKTNATEHLRVTSTGDMTQKGSHATGNGTRFTLSNTSTGASTYFQGGTANNSSTIDVVDNDDLVIKTNDTTALRVKAAGGLNIASAGGTGGNVPHTCSRSASSTSSSTNITQSCSAGEIVVGGGCTSGGDSITANYPSSTTAWNCQFVGSASHTAYAICCQY